MPQQASSNTISGCIQVMCDKSKPKIPFITSGSLTSITFLNEFVESCSPHHFAKQGDTAMGGILISMAAAGAKQVENRTTDRESHTGTAVHAGAG